MKWLLLIITLPTQNATARMRAWRTLKASGAAVLRDGVYLLPNTAEHSELFNKIEQDVSAAEGTAYCLQVVDDYPFAELFNRDDDYQQPRVSHASSQSRGGYHQLLAASRCRE